MTNTPFAWPLSTEFKFEIWLHHLIFKKKQHISMSSMSYGRRHLTKRPVILTWLVLRRSDVTGTFKYNLFGWRTGWRWPQWLLGHPCGSQCDILSWGCPINQAEVTTDFLDLVGWLFAWWTDLTKQKPRCPAYLQSKYNLTNRCRRRKESIKTCDC